MNGPCLRVVNDCQSILQTEKNHRLVDDDDDDDADDLKNVLEANYISNLKFERKMKVNLSSLFSREVLSLFWAAKGGDSCSEGLGFESWHCVLD